MKKWMKVVIIILLIGGFLYWYLNYQAKKNSPEIKIEETPKESKSEIINSIPLEKPPFIKE